MRSALSILTSLFVLAATPAAATTVTPRQAWNLMCDAGTGRHDPGDPVAEPTPRERRAMIDRMRRAVERTVDGTARGFDRLFGDARAFEEAERSRGSVSFGGLWREDDGLEPVGRARIKWRLPALEQKLHLVAGRDAEDRLVTDEEDQDGLPDEIDPDEQGAVAGVDWAPVEKRRHRLSLGGGLTYEDAVEPYVKVRSRSRWPVARRSSVHLRVTPFWQGGDRSFGVQARVDLDTQVSPDVVMRWTVRGQRDGIVLGTRYFAGPTVYHRINDRYSMAHRAGVRGETGEEVPDRSYRYVASLRRTLWREWFFIELSAGVDWRRETLAEPRDTVPLAGLLFELQFGDDG